MYTDRQILFLIKRFNNDRDLISEYLLDLCSNKKVKVISTKYSIRPAQIQRDRNHFIERNVVPAVLKKLNLN